MIIAQISDFHVRATSAAPGFGIDNNANLRAAVDALNALEPRPDVVLATGDLTNRGETQEYAALRGLLEPLEPPLFLIPGNHDDKERLRRTFADHTYLPCDDPTISYTVEDYPLRLIALDSTVAGRHDGLVCAVRRAWLESTLAEAPERPTLIFMHHPPFQSGIWWMDGIGILCESEELGCIIDAHRQVKRIVCGHLHRCVHSMFGQTPVSVSPSTAYQVSLDLTPESPPRFSAEPPAFHLHLWNGTTLVTHTALVRPPVPIDLRPLMPDWPERCERTRNRLGIPKNIGY